MIRTLLVVTLLGLAGGCVPRHTVMVLDKSVTIVLRAPEASVVQFASSADRYALRPAVKDKQGNWVVAGIGNQEFQYFYLVDGKVFLPDCRYRQADDFGTANCRYLPE